MQNVPHLHDDPYHDHSPDEEEFPAEWCNLTIMARPNDDRLYCPPTKDKFNCWNYTLAGSLAKQHCPLLTAFVHSEFAYKECTANGTWFIHPATKMEWTNLKRCVPYGDYHVYVYFLGYSLSILGLLVSLAILFTLKRLDCDRIRLHQHLFICHLLNAATSIIYFLFNEDPRHSPVFCQILFIATNYFGVATYFWLFAEGLYLLSVLAFTFHIGRYLLWTCMAIGWGVPMLLTTVYNLVRFFMDETLRCGLTQTSHSTYILHIPVILSIACNSIFMILILRMLVIKMRQQNVVYMPQPDTQHWWKTAKAILILTPVLGAYHLLLLVKPDENRMLVKVHNYTSAVVVSFQGFFVTVPFCFLNREVHEAIADKYRQTIHRGFGRQVPRPVSAGAASAGLNAVGHFVSLPLVRNNDADDEEGNDVHGSLPNRPMVSSSLLSSNEDPVT